MLPGWTPYLHRGQAITMGTALGQRLIYSGKQPHNIISRTNMLHGIQFYSQAFERNQMRKVGL